MQIDKPSDIVYYNIAEIFHSSAGFYTFKGDASRNGFCSQATVKRKVEGSFISCCGHYPRMGYTALAQGNEKNGGSPVELLRLYLVDDEINIVKGLSQTYPWNEMGYELVGTALSGEAALKDFKSVRPDVVLTDIRMRGMTGIELIKKAREILPNTLFIVISAYRDFEYAQSACEMGAYSYLLKPFDDEQINSVMRSARETWQEQKKLLNEHDSWKKILVENKSRFQENMIEAYLREQITKEEL
ncbi:response regulator [Lachnospiraceae bacterium ZAX-1]